MGGALRAEWDCGTQEVGGALLAEWDCGTQEVGERTGGKHEPRITLRIRLLCSAHRLDYGRKKHRSFNARDLYVTCVTT